MKLYKASNKRKTATAYLLAENYNDACSKFESWLNRHGYGFGENEIVYIELIAKTDGSVKPENTSVPFLFL